jgi:hypothetical protein
VGSGEWKGFTDLAITTVRKKNFLF